MTHGQRNVKLTYGSRYHFLQHASDEKMLLSSGLFKDPFNV